MNEERTMILEMLQSGKISLEEANRLLDALPKEETAPRSPEPSETPVYSGETPTKLRVEVTRSGRRIVNVRLPISLVRTGLKLGKAFGKTGGKYATEQAAAVDALQDLDIDEVMNTFYTLGESLPYTIVDVDEENGEHVTVMLE